MSEMYLGTGCLFGTDTMTKKKKKKGREHAWQGTNVKNEEFKVTSECDPVSPTSWFTGEFYCIAFYLFYFIVSNCT